MKLIGLEEHFWTKEIQDALGRLSPEERDDSIALFQTELVSQRLEDIGAGRLAEMDKIGLDAAILSMTPPATQSLPPREAVLLARQANDRLAAATSISPARLFGFATLPTPAPAAAVDELKRAVEELGFKGAMIHGRTGLKYLDHPDFRPILAQAATLDVPIYIHPQIAPRSVRAVHYDGFDPVLSVGFATGGWGWHHETGINALRLILSGVFDEFPKLQIILGHWGEMVAFFLERANEMSPVAKRLKKPIADYFRSNFYLTPSGMFSDTYLRFALEIIGPDRIMFSTDYPFQNHPEGSARKFLGSAQISDADRHKIAHGNAERLLRL